MPYGPGTYGKQVGRPPDTQKAAGKRQPSGRDLLISKMKQNKAPVRKSYG